MRRGLVCAVLLLVPLAGCGGGESGNGKAKRATPSSAGAIPSLAGATLPPGVTTQSPAPGFVPEVKESSEDKLPEGFPADFPLPRDRRIVYSLAVGDVRSVFFASALSSPAIRDFMIAELAKAGWTLNQCQSAKGSPDPITVMTASKGGRTAQITIGYTAALSARSKERFSFLVAILPTPGGFPATSPAAC